MGLPDAAPPGGRIVRRELIDRGHHFDLIEVVYQTAEQLELERTTRRSLGYRLEVASGPDVDPWLGADLVEATLVEARATLAWHAVEA